MYKFVLMLPAVVLWVTAVSPLPAHAVDNDYADIKDMVVNIDDGSLLIDDRDGYWEVTSTEPHRGLFFPVNDFEGFLLRFDIKLVHAPGDLFVYGRSGDMTLPGARSGFGMQAFQSRNHAIWRPFNSLQSTWFNAGNNLKNEWATITLKVTGGNNAGFALSVSAVDDQYSFFIPSDPVHDESSDEIGSGASEIWWIAGDTHVTTTAEGLDQAVSDMNDLHPGLDNAIILGDLMETHEHRSYFMESMSRLDVEDWSYVLGNHDFGPDLKPVMPVKFWGETRHGIRFIYLSDEVSGAINNDLVMGVDQKEWFFSELERYRGKPVFLFTHQPHTEFDLFDEIDFDRHDIRAWFHAHKHMWMIKGPTEFGFHQLGVNAVSGSRDPRRSAVLYIDNEGEGTSFTLRFRRHDTREWEVIGETSIQYEQDEVIPPQGYAGFQFGEASEESPYIIHIRNIMIQEVSDHE